MASAAELHITVSGTVRRIFGGWVTIVIPKGTVILPTQEFVEGLRRGKQQKRRLAFEARQPPEEDR